MRLGVDVGGTFTDLVLAADDGTVRVAKVASTPTDQSEGILAGVERLGVDLRDLTRFAHGTTVATNAVLERRGARTVLVTTRGFRDLLEIARQDRPSLYDLTVTRTPPLVPRGLVVEAEERVAADGSVLSALTDADAVARAVADLEPEAVAICLLFSFLDPSHEQAVEDAIRALLPEVSISRSSDVLPVFREYERADTTALNAYVGPQMRRYLTNLGTRLRDAGLDVPVEVMRSGGGTFTAEVAATYPVHTLLSGPAAGAWGAAAVARAADHTRLLCVDVGGTSSDVCLVEGGQPQTTAEGAIDGLPFGVSTTEIHTIGSGGGSVAWRDSGGALRVGPRSAGADPGPACYGRGGTEPTVTDANLVLGRLGPDPRLGGDLPLDRALATASIARLADELDLTPLATAEGIVRVVEAQMVAALRVVSVERGRDPRDLTLVPFGGAGPLHQAALARELGCRDVLIPRHPGVLCALGLLAAPMTTESVRTHLRPADGADHDELTATLDELEERAIAQLQQQGATVATVERQVALRYRGQAFELEVAAATGAAAPRSVADLVAAFHDAHQDRYGYAQRDEAVELVTLRVRASADAPDVPLPHVDAGTGAVAAATGSSDLVVDGKAVSARIYDRARLGAGDTFDGPAIVTGLDATAVVWPGQRAEVSVRGDLHLHVLSGGGPIADVSDVGASIDPITLEVTRNALTGIAEEAGAALRRTAYSPNIKERIDCSTALFGADGGLIAQAEHIPVHLGSMPASVAAALATFGELLPGDQVLVSDPYSGGTHLPDWTLVAPVHLEDGALIGYAANRAHHSDVGGSAPGSMPAGATDAFAEGLRIPPIRLYREGVEDPDLLRLLLANTRTPRERVGDLRAQVGANRLSARRLAELCARVGGPDALAAISTATQAHAEAAVRAAIAAMPDGTATFTDVLDDDGVTAAPVTIRVTVTIDGDRLVFDFDGTDAQVRGSVNAPVAVTLSCAYFVLRAVTDPTIPANAGAYRAVEVRTPTGSVVDPVDPAAVSAGNVETSQRIVDVLFGALAQLVPDRVPAASQGTMNNTLLGGSDPRTGLPFTYYETLAGGQGGHPDQPGMHGVHTAMTNTRNTPVEAFELAYPMRVLTYQLRDGSGGAGHHPGGDGIRRTLEMLTDDATLSLLTERRTRGPWGLVGGEDGAPGRNTLIRDGIEEPLPGKVTRPLRQGDRITIDTPGGGGHGTP